MVLMLQRGNLDQICATSFMNDQLCKNEKESKQTILCKFFMVQFQLS